jgi:hypothetical protein
MASLHMKTAVSMVDSLEGRESEKTERKRPQSEEEQVFFLKKFFYKFRFYESAWPLYIFSFYDNSGERMASLHIQFP